MAKQTTHFGYEAIDPAAKAGRVDEVFRSVADRYDVMNDLMSAGTHRLWKRWTLAMANIKPGQRVLDLAGGTGDLAAPMARKVGPWGQVVLADINETMLVRGRDRLVDRGLVGDGLSYVQADAERLPFAANRFDCITIAFGLRNVTDQAAALRAMYHCLRPAGRLLVLEFSRPRAWLKPAYDLYSFNMLPLMGRLVANDAASYRYLAESIRMHPDQKTLKEMMEQAGFERVSYQNMSGGIVALHRAYKI